MPGGHGGSPSQAKTQRNHVFERLVAYDLEPAAFEWHTDYSEGNQISRLQHSSSDYFCIFDYIDNNGWLTMAPGPNQREQRVLAKGPSWPHTLTEVSNWASRLKAEIEAPDLWAWIAEPGSPPRCLSADTRR